MIKFFVQDPTDKRFYYFDTVPQLVSFLERLIVKVLGQTRAQFMDNMASLGHGYDDPQGITFTRGLAADHFYIGAVRQDGQHFRCDVHAANNFSKPEYGN